MKTILGVMAAVGVLVVGVALAATVSGAFDAAEAQADPAIEEQAPEGHEAEGNEELDTDHGFVPAFAGDFIDDVRADLVEDETITSDQAEQIAAAFEERIDEMLADLPDLDALREAGGPLFGFFEDGELSEEERAELEEMFGDRFSGGEGFHFFGEDGKAPEGRGGFPFGDFRFFLDDGDVPEELREFLDGFSFEDMPFGEFLEDGELSDEERAQLHEFFSQFRGRGFGGLFEGLDPAADADEAAFSA